MTLHEKMEIPDPLKALSDQVWLYVESWLFSIGSSLQKWFLHFWPEIGFKGTVVNRVLSSFHGGLIEITLTQPLRISYIS